MAQVAKSDLRDKVRNMGKKKAEVQNKTKVSNDELGSALEEYDTVKRDMDKLFGKFKEVGFETTVSKQEMPYDATTVLTENNITDYL